MSVVDSLWSGVIYHHLTCLDSYLPTSKSYCVDECPLSEIVNRSFLYWRWKELLHNCPMVQAIVGTGLWREKVQDTKLSLWIPWNSDWLTPPFRDLKRYAHNVLLSVQKFRSDTDVTSFYLVSRLYLCPSVNSKVSTLCSYRTHPTPVFPKPST